MIPKDPQLLRRIRKKAAQSSCKFRVAAYGFNRRGELVSKSANLPRFDRKGGGIHAEMRVMQEARQKGIATILICRIDRSGNFSPIKPCIACQKKADELGIKIHSIEPE